MRIIAFLSYRLTHIFTPGQGPFNVCMHCLGVSWALDLGACFSHLFSYQCTSAFSSHLIWLCYSSLLPYPIYYLFVSYSLHLEWWASSVHHMEDSHIIFTIYLTDIGLEILSLRRSSCQREFVCYLSTGGCVHLLSISSLGFICSHSGYAYLHICKKKTKSSLLLSLAHVCMCIVFSIIEYVYWRLGVIFIKYVRYWEFVCELSEIPWLFVLLCHIYFVREMSDLLLRALSHCPFHHHVHYWCDFT